MFGPNTHVRYDGVVDYSHRDARFSEKYLALQTVFKNKFNLNDYDISFIPGSGTVGIEAVFWSLNKDINIIGCEGSFSKRWRRLKRAHPKTITYGDVDLYCQLETSVSCVFEKGGCLIDAVSSFPFYGVPEDTKIFVTCANKQLGSLVGLAIVCVRKDYWQYMRGEEEFSYLNLSRYKKYQKIEQTPSTAPTYIYEHLAYTLSKLNVGELRNKIIKNSEILVDAIGEDKFIGEKACPALTINKRHIPLKLAEKWQIYGLNSECDNYHIFTYSCKNSDYKRFANEFRKILGRK